MHGKLYFTTFGDIDGYCNDNKDDAQCPKGVCDV